MKLGKILTPKYFYLSIFLIFLISLIFLAGLYYILNLQYRPSKNRFLAGPVTTLSKSLRLDIEQPGDDILSFESSEVIAGKTSPFSDVLISTETQDTVVKSKADGSFSTVLHLNLGVNAITVVVFDSTGDSRSDTKTVFYSKEKI